MAPTGWASTRRVTSHDGVDILPFVSDAPFAKPVALFASLDAAALAEVRAAARINALTREFALPTGGARRIATGQQRAEAMNELARVKQEIDRGKQQIADIEEEARKAGVPPGWLR